VTCSLDGIETPCDQVISRLQAGAAVQCPDNQCSGVGTVPGTNVTAVVQFMAFAGGTTGYFYGPQLNNGINEVNGMILTDAQYDAYVQATYGGEIEAQRVALAQAIAANSGISYEDAYRSLVVQGGHLQGGNYNFVENTYGPGDLICGADAARCNGIHFVTDSNGQTFFHLDTSNPFTDLFGLFQHAFVDVFLGNIAYTVIPRPW